MEASAAAAGSADAPASAAHAEGAEAEDADTEQSSSDSELPDTTAPAVEEQSGAGDAAPPERSPADVDMATDMTEAAAADPNLTVGELLQKSEVYLQQCADEAGAAAPGAPSSGSAAPASDARLLEGIDAFMGKGSAKKAEDQDDPMEGPPKKEESSSEELVPDDPGRAHKSATKVPRQFRAATHTAPPPATMAAYTDEAPVIPATDADGMHACPDCGKGLDSGVRWLLHRAANQDFRGQWFRINRDGVFFELTEAHYARSAKKLGSGVVIPLLVKGDRIRLKDGTRLLYGEGFDEESEEVDVPSPAKEDVPSYGGGVRGPSGIEMRDDPDEQEQIRKLRERGSHQSAQGWPQQGFEARAAGVEYDAGAASSGGVNPPKADDCFYQPVGGPHAGARCQGNRAAGHWCPDDNIIPWSAPNEWRNSWEASRLQEYEDEITPDLYCDDNRIAEVFTSRMREIAERKEAKAERKRAALAAIRASLLVGGWLCPTCNEWNLSFRNLCYRCNGKRTAAGVLSRGIPDPRRNEQDRDESDSDDSAAIDLRREQEDDLEETVMPFLRSTRTKRGSGSKKRSNPPGGAQGGGGVAAALAAPVLLSIQRGSVGVVDETLAAVAQQSAELVQEVGAEAARTVQVAGRTVSIIALILCAAETWFVARAVLNRLVHALKGNSLPAVLVEMVGGEATFAVQGKRTQAMHKVWIRLASKEAACGCKAFLQEGTCGHCDAAVQTAIQMGIVKADPSAAAPEVDPPAELRSRVVARGLAALPTQECFSGLAAKSREISCLSGLLKRGGSSPGAPAATSVALAVPAPAFCSASGPALLSQPPKAESSGLAASEVAYLAGDSYVAAGLDALAKTKSRDKVFLRAYSFDAPSVLEALEGACARGAACCLIADASQCSKTKLQWQSLKRVASAGVAVRLATGHSVRDAYAADGRGAVVGAGLKGLHHAKALLVVGDTAAELIVGSLNWSTSSKANSECGLRLAVASGAPVVVDFIRDFEAIFAGASPLDDVKPPAPKGAAASSGARHGPPTSTV
ncbi:pol [Symbiodinium sp. KB8]|nr:pol [Symbiodinium sp. KB8]